MANFYNPFIARVKANFDISVKKGSGDLPTFPSQQTHSFQIAGKPIEW